MNESQSTIQSQLYKLAMSINKLYGFEKYNTLEILEASSTKTLEILINDLKEDYFDNPEVLKKLRNYMEVIKNIDERSARRLQRSKIERELDK